MAERKWIDEQKLDNIALLVENGLKIEQIASIVGIGHASASRVKAVIIAAKNNDYEAMQRSCRGSQRIIDWACMKYGIKSPESKQEAPQEAPKQEKPDNTATAFSALLESIKELTAAVNAIDKRLSAMQLTQQGFRGDMGEKIGKVVEAVNVNGDILTKEHDKMIELLGGIKSNTKRRGDA